MRSDLISRSEQTKSLIVKVLSESPCGMTLTEVAEVTGLPRTTVKRHLERLESIGYVLAERHRGATVYYWLGEGENTEVVELDDNHILTIDTVKNPFGKPLIRVALAARLYGRKYCDIGAILIPVSKLHEFIKKLEKVVNIGEKSGNS